MKRLLSILSMTLILCLALGFAPAAQASAIFNAEELFSARDLKQEADLSKAAAYNVSDGQDIHITASGIYVLTGSAKNVTVYVEAGTEDKVQIVLDGVTVTNTNFPVIYAKTADKVFVTVSADSSLSVTGSFISDGSVNTDGVIFAKTDLVLNGTASLTVSSTYNGIVCKDDLKITGGTYNITAQSKAFEANDSIRISDGTLNLIAGTDGLHAENAEDDTKGYIYVSGGTLTINAGDDAIHANSVVQIDGGSFSIRAGEGIEGTYIQVNGGSINIQSADDGINAAHKSSAYRATVEINGGEISVAMAGGDTDGIDSNGDIIINGGSISVTGNSTFDYDGSAQYNGGTIIANGQQLSYIPNQMMGGGGRGGWGNMGGGSMNGGWGGSGGGRGGWGGRGR